MCIRDRRKPCSISSKTAWNTRLRAAISASPGSKIHSTARSGSKTKMCIRDRGTAQPTSPIGRKRRRRVDILNGILPRIRPVLLGQQEHHRHGNSVPFDHQRIRLQYHPVKHRPVSYTHLDVYKRQGLACRKIPERRRSTPRSLSPLTRSLASIRCPRPDSSNPD